MSSKIFPVCVIGGGAAGTMAVLRVILNNDECLFFPGSPIHKKRSRAFWVKKVENMPAYTQYEKGIDNPNQETMKWIETSAFKHNLHKIKNTGVISLKKLGELFEITDSKGEIFLAQYIILCTGVMDVQPHIQGTIKEVFDFANAQMIDYCLICDGHHVLHKNVSIIGHTNSAAWSAIMLHERYQPKSMSILTNGEKPEFQKDTLKLINHYGFRIIESPILKILGESKGKILRGFQTESVLIESDICFVSLGMIVYNDLAKQLGADLDDRGFVKCSDSGESSVAGLFVAGDLKSNSKKQIYTAWDQAVNAANSINQKIRVSKRPI